MTIHNVGDVPQIRPSEYEDFAVFLKSICGIDLGANKQYLVATRIRRVMVEHNIKSLSELTNTIRSDANRLLRQKVVDAMTTNETFWFRDSYPFDYMARVLIPEFSKKNKDRRMRIWCSACSSGQEPYSVSMVIEECLRSKFGVGSAEAEILATDVSSSVLQVAKMGCYDKISVVRGLSDVRTRDHFERTHTDSWSVKEHIKKRVTFRPANLQESYFLLGKFDVIFCRNVLIYFSAELKTDILTKMHGALNKDGLLFLGSSESITGLGHLYKMVNCNPGVAYQAI